MIVMNNILKLTLIIMWCVIHSPVHVHAVTSQMPCPYYIIYYYMTCMYRQNVHYNSSDSENHQVAALIRHHCEFAQLFHFTTTNNKK